ncbi:MAG: hypothetical protein NUW21_09420, partial [Elusimicrobia bacterium]|nr:hypothetical protein [Elusimicrobiota bacterium]
GTVTGKTGTLDVLTAGDPYAVTLRAVDLYNNRASDGRQVLLSANDPYANIPAPQSLALGQAIFAGFLPSAATGNLVVSGVDNDVIIPALTGQTVSTITVVPGAPNRMIIALNGQTLVPGKTVAPFGVTGVPTQSTAGVFFPATVYATDSRYNVVATVDKPAITVTSDDPFASNVGSFAMNSGAASLPSILLRTAGTRVLTASDGGGGTDPLPTNGVSSGFDLLANNPTRLRVLVPGETRVPGSTTNGRTGTANPAQAGFVFNATVDLADAFWNLTPGVTQQIRLVADDPFAVIVPTTQVITTSATYAVTLKRAGATILRAEMVDSLSLPTVSKDSSTAITVLAGTPSRLLAVLPGETFSQGSPTGKGGTPIAQTAGTDFDVQVGVVDGFFNLVPARPANVLVTAPTDPYAPAVSTAAINVGTGFTAPMTVSLRRAATGQFLSALDFGPPPSGLVSDPQSSTFTVLPAAPKGLQLLLPGQVAVPGSGDYPNGGVTGSVSTPTAGGLFDARINLVDQYMNVSPHPTTPLEAYLNTSDLFDVETASGPSGSGKLLPATLGTETVGVTLVTKSSLTVISVSAEPSTPLCGASGTDLCLAQAPAAVSVPFRVFASTDYALQVFLPGETQRPGKPSGKDGTPNSYVVTSGAMTATVWLVDQFNNPVSDIPAGTNQDTNPPAVMPTVRLSFPSDPAAAVPAENALNLGSRSFNFSPLTAATAYTVVATTTAASAVTFSSRASAAFPVHPGPADHLVWSGLPATVVAGVTFSGVLSAHDVRHNVLSTGPFAYNKSVSFSAKLFGGNQNPTFTPGTVVFSSTTDQGVKSLPGFLNLKKAGNDHELKAFETLNTALHSEMGGVDSIRPVITVVPAAPESIK